MIITLEDTVRDGDKKKILAKLSESGYAATEVKTQDRRYLVAIGSKEVDIRVFGHLPGVRDVHRVSDVYKLVSRKWKAAPSTVSLGDEVSISEGNLSLMFGPCSIEGEEQVKQIVEHLKSVGVRIMRGGVFKPRSSPYSFQGHGTEALKMFSEIARPAGIRIVTEVLSVTQISDMYPYVDMFQVGTRNSQNFDLLRELGKLDKPVLLKRGMSGTLEELFQSAEYVFSSGNERLVLCERGIRTYEPAYRNTLDLNAIPVLKEKSHLPVVVDPSHGIGVRRWVIPMALASIMAGADGLLVEIHPTPEQAASDGAQTLNFSESSDLVRKVRETFALRERLSVSAC